MDTLQENLPGNSEDGIQETKKETLLKRVAIKIFGIVTFVTVVVILLTIVLTLGLSSSHPG